MEWSGYPLDCYDYQSTCGANKSAVNLCCLESWAADNCNNLGLLRNQEPSALYFPRTKASAISVYHISYILRFHHLPPFSLQSNFFLVGPRCDVTILANSTQYYSNANTSCELRDNFGIQYGGNLERMSSMSTFSQMKVELFITKHKSLLLEAVKSL